MTSPKVRPSAETSRRMKAVRRRDTRPERELRSALHALGLRFRVDAPPTGGSRRRADVVFPKAKLAVYVDGCFWHSCPQHATVPRTNRDWWIEKLAANVSRDRRADRELAAAGWGVLRIWEHEDMVAAAERVAGIYSARIDGADHSQDAMTQ